MIRTLFQKYRHGFMLLYAFIYLPWFIYLEKTVVRHYHVIHMKIDDYIPFNEYFIIPYMLWFIYMGGAIAYFFFKDVKDYYRLTTFLFTGMTIFLIISTLFPNGHNLRPVEFVRDNIFVDAVKQLYKADTATNLFPSIHVFNSLVVHISISKSSHFKDKKWIRLTSLCLMVSIILSTVLLKQHSIFDVITAFIMFTLLYPLVYKFDPLFSDSKKKDYEQQFDNII